MKQVVLSILVVVLATFSGSGAYSAGTSKGTDDVWQHHIAAWTSRNVDEIVADYSEDSVVIMVNKVYRGKGGIRNLFLDLFKTFDRAKDHHIDPAIVIGKVVYITWRAKIDGVDFPLGTDTFVIDRGKILYQTITSTPILF